MTQRPLLITYRTTGSDAAILLIHGFNAEANRTWSQFSQLLSHSPALDLQGIWTGNPDLQTLAGYREAVALEPPPQPRQLESMHAQACQLATLLGHHDQVQELSAIFRGG